MNLKTTELKAFVPSSDLKQSLAFYVSLGFESPWSSDDLAVLRHGIISFFLQTFNDKSFIENYMMHLKVENLQDWYDNVKKSADIFKIDVANIAEQPWGEKDFTFKDPSGVCWRVAQE